MNLYTFIMWNPHSHDQIIHNSSDLLILDLFRSTNICSSTHIVPEASSTEYSHLRPLEEPTK
ncbi:hypothetical protein BDQ17DRAFT_1349869 [Cyathus striatus]|nr:hypothetical protein BDQ17DRAFT_1349869 [Cyathus striatus]